MQRIFLFEEEPEKYRRCGVFWKKGKTWGSANCAPMSAPYMFIWPEVQPLRIGEVPGRAEKVQQLCFHKMIIEYCNLASGVL